MGRAQKVSHAVLKHLRDPKGSRIAAWITPGFADRARLVSA